MYAESVHIEIEKLSRYMPSHGAHTNPKRKRGKDLRTSLALRVRSRAETRSAFGPPVSGDACVALGRRFCVLGRQRGASPTANQDTGLISGRKRHSICRRGLSALELVLCLPLLLMIMALMVNYGVVASWNVRGLMVSRHAVWSTRWPRNLNRLPRPSPWLQPITVAAEDAGDIASLDDPRVDHPVARGPLSGGNNVKRRLLDPARGLRNGKSSIERRFPMLPSLGEYHLSSDDYLLDDKWQYQRTRVPANVSRRIPAIYELARAGPALKTSYIRAAVALRSWPGRQRLEPLYRDDEFIAYNERFGLGGPPDFRPRMRSFCSLDQAVVASRVEDLVDRIQGKEVRNSEGAVIRRIPGVAERMAVAFRNLYRRVIRRLEAELEANEGRPGFPSGAIRLEIRQLEAKVTTLDDFIAELRN